MTLHPGLRMPSPFGIWRQTRVLPGSPIFLFFFPSRKRPHTSGREGHATGCWVPHRRPFDSLLGPVSLSQHAARMWVAVLRVPFNSTAVPTHGGQGTLLHCRALGRVSRAWGWALNRTCQSVLPGGEIRRQWRRVQSKSFHLVAGGGPASLGAPVYFQTPHRPVRALPG